jgi:amidase
MVTIGTETNGSIVCPSTANGVVGIKPTVGLVSRSGVIPISFSQDTAGPMARTVTDAALLLGALTGVDEKDKLSMASDGIALTDYTPYLKEDGLKGKRIGVWKSKFGNHEGVDAALEPSLKALEDAGAELVELETVIENMGELRDSARARLQYEFKDGVNAYLATASPSTGVKTLSDVIAYNQTHEEEAMPFFRMEILELSDARGDLTDEEYLTATNLIRSKSREGINTTMDEWKLDAIVAPTGGPAWCTDLVNGDHSGGGSSTPAAWAGYPNITVPAGYVHGLPVGLSFFGRAWSEGALIEIAYAFEQHTKARRVPKFNPTIDY